MRVKKLDKHNTCYYIKREICYIFLQTVTPPIYLMKKSRIIKFFTTVIDTEVNKSYYEQAHK